MVSRKVSRQQTAGGGRQAVGGRRQAAGRQFHPGSPRKRCGPDLVLMAWRTGLVPHYLHVVRSTKHRRPTSSCTWTASRLISLRCPATHSAGLGTTVDSSRRSGRCALTASICSCHDPSPHRWCPTLHSLPVRSQGHHPQVVAAEQDPPLRTSSEPLGKVITCRAQVRSAFHHSPQPLGRGQIAVPRYPFFGVMGKVKGYHCVPQRQCCLYLVFLPSCTRAALTATAIPRSRQLVAGKLCPQAKQDGGEPKTLPLCPIPHLTVHLDRLDLEVQRDQAKHQRLEILDQVVKHP